MKWSKVGDEQSPAIVKEGEAARKCAYIASAIIIGVLYCR